MTATALVIIDQVAVNGRTVNFAWSRNLENWSGTRPMSVDEAADASCEQTLVANLVGNLGS
jgi:hypothetical protein